MSETLELRGLLSKIDAGFAFATTERGNVFIPIAAAKTKNEQLLSLADKFRQNEEVRLTVVKQTSGQKNNCKWLAKTIRKVEGAASSSSKISNERHGPMLATVTSISETYCFCLSDFGTVFVPGDAFDATYVQNVQRYLKIDDLLIITIQEQIERNGVKWVAIEAVKHFDLCEKQEIEGIEEATPSSSQKELVKKKDYILGFGIVLEVEPMEVHVYDERNVISVHCSLLTYTGGTLGKPSAKTLHDVINVNDMVMFKAERAANFTYSVVNWKQIIDTDDFEIPRKVRKADSYVQTPLDLVTMVFKRLMHDYPKELDRLLPVIEQFPDEALPDTYICRREEQRRAEQEEDERRASPSERPKSEEKATTSSESTSSSSYSRRKKNGRR